MTIGNSISLKSINELLSGSFFIPAYQRGYKWTVNQVTDLLNDIDAFKPKEGEWYCLQPLVVKKSTNAEKEKFKHSKDQEWYEVIDGQQRLTTIALIIHYFNEMWVGKQKIKEPNIQYQTRDESACFLKSMKVEDDDIVKINASNIDFFHLSTAYKAIHDWCKRKESFDNNRFQSKFKEHTKVIWYEVSAAQDGRDIFSRINMGKISLTNAELIKSLFLNSSNFKKQATEADEERIRLKQLEIATEWDLIETALHKDEFWLFINKTEVQKQTRIEFIFELLVGKPTQKDDIDFTFRAFQQKFTDNTEQVISDNWKEVKRYFQTLQSWFEDRPLYHKIGFLITLGEAIQPLIKSAADMKKTAFIEQIDQKIIAKLKDVQLHKIEYSNSETVRKILLLHNLQTMLDNGNENSRFPFNRFKTEKWDIEHVHAIQTEMKGEELQKAWLEEAKKFIKAQETELLKRIETSVPATFEALFNDILNHFSEHGTHEQVNDISNLVLLDRGTNRGYKNAVFPVKRKTIIEKEKEGTFVPICTKNVFMKYYSASINQLTFWGKTDRDAYLDNIESVLKTYLPTQTK